MLRLIYFVTHATHTSPIKIGYTEDASRLLTRMETAMTWSPWGVKVLATCSGGRTFEKELHRLFRKDRVRSEWFRGSPALHELIDWCKKHPNADVAAIRAAAEKALGVTEMRTNMSRKARAKRSKSRLAAKIKSGEITIKQLPKEPND